MLDSLLDLISGSPWTYAVVFAFAVLDAVFPAVPSETAVITAGVLAASGDLHLGLVVPAAAAGAMLGDNTAYWIGRTFERFVSERLFHGKRRRHLERAEATLAERGGYLIVIARFIPGGRTAVTFASGVLRFRWPRFLAFDALAGVLWASYAGLVGYFGGKAFEDHPTRGLLLALAIAFLIAAAVEGYRFHRRRARRRRERPEAAGARDDAREEAGGGEPGGSEPGGGETTC